MRSFCATRWPLVGDGGVLREASGVAITRGRAAGEVVEAEGGGVAAALVADAGLRGGTKPADTAVASDHPPRMR